MYDVVIGRSEQDRVKYGTKGAVYIGKHYVKMGQTTALSNKVYLDVSGSHVVFVVGKRGSGKSYSLAVIAEGILDLPQEIKQNISVVMLDTMGVFWTMKYPNKKDYHLLAQWGLEAKSLNVDIYTPTGFYKKYKEEGIPTDHAFSIKPSELTAADWCITFDIDENDALGVLVTRIINDLRKSNKEYDIEEIVERIKNDTKSEMNVKFAVENRFRNAEDWGLFDIKGTPLRDISQGGRVTVLDVSCYATMSDGWKIKALVIGLIAQKLFIERMKARKDEEYKEITQSLHFFSEEEKKQEMPLVWLIIDEAHEFLPFKGKTVASQPLITVLREGRQPGISLILASQQPGKIHTDVMTQADTVLAHRITAKLDTEALGMLMQSYMREGLTVQLDNLPRTKGSAIIFDDENEKMFPIAVRPRFTWHGGGSPTALHEETKKIEF